MIPVALTAFGLIFGGLFAKKAFRIFNIRLVERSTLERYEENVEETELIRKKCMIELKTKYKKEFVPKQIR